MAFMVNRKATRAKIKVDAALVREQKPVAGLLGESADARTSLPHTRPRSTMAYIAGFSRQAAPKMVATPLLKTAPRRQGPIRRRRESSNANTCAKRGGGASLPSKTLKSRPLAPGPIAADTPGS